MKDWFYLPLSDDDRVELDWGAGESYPQSLPISRIIAERLIQEEVWASTFWPDGEVTLEDLLIDYQCEVSELKERIEELENQHNDIGGNCED